MKALLLYSGGLDSTTLLYAFRGNIAACLFLDYGQKHGPREFEAAYGICLDLDVPLVQQTVQLPTSVRQSSALTSNLLSIPHDVHHEAPEQVVTVVPGRNMILVATAVAVAQAIDCDHVLVGAHLGDHAIYPDCRPEFFSGLCAATMSAYGVVVWAPFARWSKARVVAKARQLDVPIERTWTCYVGGAEPCGTCASCRERTEALNKPLP